MAEQKLHRIQKVVLPLLRGHDDLMDNKSVLPDIAPAKVGSWTENINLRDFPMVNIRRIGGIRHATRPKKLSKPVIEMTVYHTAGLVECEELYEDCLDVLFDAVLHQTQTPYGYLHSIKETMGATQFSSPFMDSWRVQGLIALGLRPPRN
ncbi:putative head-to-tail connector [Mycobacterium phage PP]|uniref:Putative head-to-tail connector n=1 Tax=Mycobacterium phage PP TaxID=2077134 RepID=A0A2Z5XVF6_9CAUD|nr:tail terminator [Mycobacterium phage PP]BBC53825.1 putative head-to-tail connector [Mycobacterium phage PP]